MASTCCSTDELQDRETKLVDREGVEPFETAILQGSPVARYPAQFVPRRLLQHYLPLAPAGVPPSHLGWPPAIEAGHQTPQICALPLELMATLGAGNRSQTCKHRDTNPMQHSGDTRKLFTYLETWYTTAETSC